MNKAEALAETKGQLSEMLGLPLDDISENALLIEDLGASSIEVVQLYVYFQEKGIVLSDSFNLYEPVTVADIAERAAAESQDAR